MRQMLFVYLAVAFSGLDASGQDHRIDFDRQLVPVLIDHCLDCHSGNEPKGGLNLSERSLAFQGGDSGPVIVPGDAEASLLWQRVESGEMPPSKPLSEQDAQQLAVWISEGANWGTDPIDPFRVTTNSRAGYDWWALQPLRRPDIPAGPADSRIRNPIDAFVTSRLFAEGLTPSPPAEPGTIIRRLHFDLIGLPPLPAEVSEFEKSMRHDADEAISELVERLLHSRHFGERWGRHWLDVVRFGESQGFERDKLRTDAWHYRDWVIDAMNADMPYDEFVRQQIAGDILHPDDPNAITATGFLVAGPWDEVGQNQQSAAMKSVVRQDELEDYVGTITQTFLGLTVNCARCHDHKFDPILQKEYYQLTAAVNGVRHGSREVTSLDNQQQTEKINVEIQSAQDQIAKIDAVVRNRLNTERVSENQSLAQGVSPIARWDFQTDLNDRIGDAHATQHPAAEIRDGSLVLDAGTGYAATHKQDFDLLEKTLEAWVRLTDLDQRGGAAISIHDKDAHFDAIVYAEREPRKWMSGSDFFKRTRNLDAPPEEQARDRLTHVAISYHRDGRIACYRNGQPYGQAYQSSGPRRFRAGEWHVMFGLRTGGPSPDRQLKGLLETAQLYDRALSADQILASYTIEQSGISHEDIQQALTTEERDRRSVLLKAIEVLKSKRADLKPYRVYAVVPKSPETAYVLHRGNPASRGEAVTPGGVAAIASLTSEFGLTADSTDADRRRQLARWITNPKNPLFARVIVNRLWHYHFSAGLVETPNDFGFNGARPSHPELIDWLASELVDSGYSLKHIHQLIVSSATWLQSSRHRADCVAVDAANRLLWRRNPVRLEAEALRDAMLDVAGQLNRQYGGPPYRDFETVVNNTQFYTMTDPDTADASRRTVYRTWVRSARNPLLDAFDCPDPSTTAPNRAVTNTPLQSLALMNNSFVMRMADRFAERVTTDVGPDNSSQTVRVYRLAFGHSPDKPELQEASDFVAQHGLSAFCRVVFNSNEFIHVD